MSAWLWFCIWAGLPPLRTLPHFVAAATASRQPRNYRFVVSEFSMKPLVADLFEDLNWHVSNRSAISSYLILRHSVDQVDMETSMDMLRPNKQILRLYQIRLDACQFLSTIHKNRIFNLLAKSLNGGSNVALKCPLKSHFNYTISNMRLEETDFPQYVPACQFKALTKFFVHKKIVLRLFMEGRVETKN